MSNGNLIPQSERTKEEQRKIATKGGIASGEARRRKKHGRELVRYLLEMKVVDTKIIEQVAKFGIPLEDISNEVAMTVRQMEKAQKSADTKAYTAVMKAAGYDTEGTIPEGVTIVVKSAGEAKKIQEIADLGV